MGLESGDRRALLVAERSQVGLQQAQVSHTRALARGIQALDQGIDGQHGQPTAEQRSRREAHATADFENPLAGYQRRHPVVVATPHIGQAFGFPIGHELGDRLTAHASSFMA